MSEPKTVATIKVIFKDDGDLTIEGGVSEDIKTLTEDTRVALLAYQVGNLLIGDVLGGKAFITTVRSLSRVKPDEDDEE